jgi:hypothetical protein
MLFSNLSIGVSCVGRPPVAGAGSCKQHAGSCKQLVLADSYVSDLPYADGPKNSNHYTAIWLCGVAMLLAVQAACVILAPSCSTGGPRPRARFWAWVWYTSWMAR